MGTCGSKGIIGLVLLVRTNLAILMYNVHRTHNSDVASKLIWVPTLCFFLRPPFASVVDFTTKMPGQYSQSAPQVTQKQYLDVLKAMWHIVDNYFDAKKVLTEAGHALVQTYSIHFCWCYA